MAHVVVPNSAPVTIGSVDFLKHVWVLTRAMKKAGYKVLASSDGSAKDTTGTPNADKWGGGTTVPAQTGTTASITTKTGNDLITLTGLTGLSTATFNGSEGNFLTITGAASGANNGTFQIIEVLSNTSCRIRNASGVASDANSGAISWAEKSPLLDTFVAGSFGTGCWIVLQGPSTLKIPFSVAPTGTFLRGEKVTQANTLAEGELVGITYDVNTGAGWAVILPRVTGSGGGARGWSTTDAIQGASSGATVTAAGSPEEFVREHMFFVGTRTGGTLNLMTIYSQMLSTTSENAQRFSQLAANAAGCTATIAPGAGGTSNGFPASLGAFVVTGTGGSVGHSLYAPTFDQYASSFGNAQIMVASCIERTGLSADGSFIFAAAQPSAATNAAHGGFWFQRLDDSEEGDVDPFMWTIPSVTTSAFGTVASRTVCTDSGDTADHFRSFALVRRTRWSHRGTRRRGLSSESFSNFAGAVLATGSANNEYVQVASAAASSAASYAYDPEKVAAAQVQGLVRDPIYFVNDRVGSKCRKGSARWLYLFSGTVSLATWDNKKWVQLSTGSPSADSVPLLLGPWDQATTPYVVTP